MKALKIERVPARERFRFILEGVIDPSGARSLDRLLFECQARGARAVYLDFQGVTSICTLGTAVLARQGRVYEETERRIHVAGMAPDIRAALAEVDAILYESNTTERPAPGQPPEAAPEPSPEQPPEVAPEQAAPPATTAHDPTPDEPPHEEPPKGTYHIASEEMAVLQAKLKRKLVEFRNLFEITRALNLAVDLDEVLNLLGLSIMGQFGVERLAIFLPEPRTGRLLPKQVRGFAYDHFRDFAIDPSPFREVPSEETLLTLSAMHDAAGDELLDALRASGFEWGIVLRVRRDLAGLVLMGGRGGRRGFLEDERDLLTTLANQGAVAIANALHSRAQEDRNLGLVRGMMSLIESRDVYARGTTERVVRYVTATARLLHVPKPALKWLIYGAALRDIGMITVSHLIVKNPAHLSDEEWALIKQHPTRGAKILEDMDLPVEAIEVVRHHHERWGGEGYPDGLRGNAIPLGARIVSLVDSYVAMTADRPYRRALPFDKVRQVIAENWGTPFDPTIVEVFLQVLDKIERRSRQRLGTLPSAETQPPGTAAETTPDRAGTIPVESRP